MWKYARYAIVLALIAGTSVGFFLGGAWSWLGFVVLFFVGLGLDLVAGDELDEREFSRPWLLNTLVFAKLPLLLWCSVAFAWMLSGTDLFLLGHGFEALTGYPALEARADNGWLSMFGGIASLGLFYASGTVASHELVHRTWSKAAQIAGRWMLAFTGDASFAIEHVYGHHIHVGTRRDPATARRGESVYAFIVRSTVMSYVSAWRIEKERLAKRGHSTWSLQNRMHRGNAMFACYIAFFAWAAGPLGALCYLATAVYGKAYLEVVNYIEHYGLVRVPGEPVSPRHSWNCNRRMSTWLTFNLPRHSHHHAMGQKPYWELRAYPDSPMLPFGYLTMVVIATFPPVFHALMVPRVLEWDHNYARDNERPFIDEANRRSGMAAFQQATPTPSPLPA